MDEEPYLAYMLRLWPVDVAGRVNWRASLQDVTSGQKHGFENLDALFEFLRMETSDKDFQN